MLVAALTCCEKYTIDYTLTTPQTRLGHALVKP